jgi:hypothetical protein
MTTRGRTWNNSKKLTNELPLTDTERAWMQCEQSRLKRLGLDTVIREGSKFRRSLIWLEYTDEAYEQIKKTLIDTTRNIKSYRQADRRARVKKESKTESDSCLKTSDTNFYLVRNRHTF